MSHVEHEDILPYKPEALYKLVMDIERYPEIFPDVGQVRVQHISDTRKAVDVSLQAAMHTLRYSCEVTGTPPRQIDIRATKGDFQSMEARWTFEEVAGGGTKISYRMDFDFGGLGLKNMVAQEIMRKNSGAMRDALRDYTARRLGEGGPSAPPLREAGWTP